VAGQFARFRSLATSPDAREDADMPYGNAIPWLTGDQDRPGGLELQIGWDGAEAVLELVVPDAAQGAPRIAHGGFLATLADHVMGFVAAQQEGRSAVTRQMTVDYLGRHR
jgi:hypothetical protein